MLPGICFFLAGSTPVGTLLLMAMYSCNELNHVFCFKSLPRTDNLKDPDQIVNWACSSSLFFNPKNMGGRELLGGCTDGNHCLKVEVSARTMSLV